MNKFIIGLAIGSITFNTAFSQVSTPTSLTNDECFAVNNPEVFQIVDIEAKEITTPENGYIRLMPDPETKMVKLFLAFKSQLGNMFIVFETTSKGAKNESRIFTLQDRGNLTYRRSENLITLGTIGIKTQLKGVNGYFNGEVSFKDLSFTKVPLCP